MNQDRLNGLRVAILAADGFEQSELTEPRKALDEAGAQTTVVSPKQGSIHGWNHKEWGGEVEVDEGLKSAKPSEYDALLLPGGVMNPDTLRMNASAVAFVKAFFDAGQPVAAICHGPWTVIEAGAARGPRMTSWPSLKTDLSNAGAQWVDREVVVDGQLVTSRKPADIPAFNREVIKLFAESRGRACLITGGNTGIPGPGARTARSAGPAGTQDGVRRGFTPGVQAGHGRKLTLREPLTYHSRPPCGGAG